MKRQSQRHQKAYDFVCNMHKYDDGDKTSVIIAKMGHET